MLTATALLLACAQTTIDDALIWDLVDTPGFPAGSPVQVIGTAFGNELVHRVDDKLGRHLPDGTPTFSASIAGAEEVVVLDSGQFVTARIIAAVEPGFPGAPGTGGLDVGVTFFDPQGGEVWRSRVGGPNDESRIRLVPDELGGVYALSEAVDPSLGPSWAGGVRQILITRLDGAGGRLWSTLQQVTFPGWSSTRTKSAAAHPVHGLVLATTETTPTDPDPESYLTRLLPDGQRVFGVRARSDHARLLIDDQANVYGAYFQFDVASAVDFSGLISHGPLGALRWQGGHCGATVGMIDGDGWLWALSEEVSGGLTCTVFDTPEDRRLLRIDRHTGQIVERVDLPAVMRDASIARLTMTGGEHVYVHAPRGASPFLARLSRTLGASSATCAGVPNSTGHAARLLATGDAERAENDLTLFAGSLPAGVTTLFVTGFADGLLPMPGGSEGNLCMSGPLGRFNGPGELRTSSGAGRVAIHLDLDRIPTPGARVALAPGQTVYFQAWYRDSNPLPTSNFTSAIAVTLN